MQTTLAAFSFTLSNGAVLAALSLSIALIFAFILIGYRWGNAAGTADERYLFLCHVDEERELALEREEDLRNPRLICGTATLTETDVEPRYAAPLPDLGPAREIKPIAKPIPPNAQPHTATGHGTLCSCALCMIDYMNSRHANNGTLQPQPEPHGKDCICVKCEERREKEAAAQS